MNKSSVPVLLALSACYLLLFFACQGGGDAIKKAQYITNGHKRYVTHCQNCHGAKGEGLGRLYPPLTDGNYLRENRSSLPCILVHGLSGEIEVHGIKYDTEMPANSDLTPLDVAYILTYITNSFGNRSEDIFTVEEVEKALQACSAD